MELPFSGDFSKICKIDMDGSIPFNIHFSKVKFIKSIIILGREIG